MPQPSGARQTATKEQPRRGGAAATSIHEPEALGLAVLFFDVGEEVAQGLVVDGVSWQDFGGERIALCCQDERDDDLHAVAALVAAVAEAALVAFGEVGSAFEISAREIVEEDFVVGIEEVAPFAGEVGAEGFFVREEPVVAAGEGVFGGEGEVALEQIGECGALEPVAAQPPLMRRLTGGLPLRG